MLKYITLFTAVIRSIWLIQIIVVMLYIHLQSAVITINTSLLY